MNYSESIEVFEKLFSNKMTKFEAKELLINLYKRGEDIGEIAGAAQVMRNHSIKVNLAKEIQDKLLDNCGTGGDKSNTFNISTTVSIILASLGCKIAKHGNRSVTSKSGSADMLEALGVNLNIPIDKLPIMLEECGFIFMFAINHHPAMKYIMPIRKSLPHRTIFNILGPLTNPAGAKKQLIGVFSEDYTYKIAKALSMLNSKSAIIVSSRDGLDEVSISDITYYTQLKKDGNIIDGEINPEKYGFKFAPKTSLKGGSASENAEITTAILTKEMYGPKRDIVILNTAVALMVDGKARDIQDGIIMAKEAIDSKKALAKLKEIIEVSNRF